MEKTRKIPASSMYVTTKVSLRQPSVILCEGWVTEISMLALCSQTYAKVAKLYSVKHHFSFFLFPISVFAPDRSRRPGRRPRRIFMGSHKNMNYSGRRAELVALRNVFFPASPQASRPVIQVRVQ